VSATQFVGGGAMTPRSPAGARPAVHRSTIDPHRARDDHGPVPYQVAIAAQDILDAILGDEPFELADIAPQLARLAAFTDGGHAPDRPVWTKARVLARVVELVEVYNPPPELGGDLPAVEPCGVEEFAGAR
jgi:hypothetical protein